MVATGGRQARLRLPTRRAPLKAESKVHTHTCHLFEQRQVCSRRPRLLASPLPLLGALFARPFDPVSESRVSSLQTIQSVVHGAFVPPSRRSSTDALTDLDGTFHEEQVVSWRHCQNCSPSRSLAGDLWILCGRRTFSLFSNQLAQTNADLQSQSAVLAPSRSLETRKQRVVTKSLHVYCDVREQ